MLYRGEILELNPNRRQTTYFRKACGVARLAYNWGLEEWTRQYQAGGKPNHRVLDKQFNALKRERFPFVTEVTKCAAQIALQQLGSAAQNPSLAMCLRCDPRPRHQRGAQHFAPRNLI